MKHIFVGQNMRHFCRWKCHEFPLLEAVESQDKSVLMNIDSFTRNVNIKRLDVALPSDKLSTQFFRIKLFNPYRVFYWKSFFRIEN